MPADFHPRPESFVESGLRRPGRWLSHLADLMLPVACPGCGAAGQAPCAACRRVIALSALSPVAGSLGPGLPLLSAGAFDGPLRALILAHKERGRSGLAPFLGSVLAEVVVAALTSLGPAASPQTPSARGRVLLVPVPSRASTVRRRGDDTVASITRHCAQALDRGGVPAASAPWLTHVRNVRDQAELGARARTANLAGAMGARPIGRPVPSDALVVVVDDVTTTGATLHEAVRALRASGVRVAAAATLAATARRTNDPAEGVERRGLTQEAALSLVRAPDRH